MTNKKSLKSALLMSGISILLSGVMLAGTTFAWFHDTAESGESTITAGTLKVDLEYNTTGPEGGKWESAVGKSIFETTATQKWEPGKMVFSYPIRVVNDGTKALKYSISVNVAETEDAHPLKDVIQYRVISYPTETLSKIDRATAWTNYETEEAEKSAGTLTEKDATSEVLAVVLYWKPNVKNDNDYNFNDGKEHSFKFTVDVYAQQASSEKDTVGNGYDSDVGTVPTVKPAGPAAANETSEVVYHAVEGGITDVNGVSEALQEQETLDLAGELGDMGAFLNSFLESQGKDQLTAAAPEGTVSVTPLVYDDTTQMYKADVSFTEANQQMTVCGICGIVGLLHNAVVAQKEKIQSIKIDNTVVDAATINELKPLEDTSKTNPVGFSATTLNGVLSGDGGPGWLLEPLLAWAAPYMGEGNNVLFDLIGGNIEGLDDQTCNIVITDTEGNAVTYSLTFNITPKA